MLFLSLQADKAPKSPQGQAVNANTKIQILASLHWPKVPFHFHRLDFRLGLMCRNHSLSVPIAANNTTKYTSWFNLWKLS